MVTAMAITCPPALGLAVPLVGAVSTSLAAGRGLLIRGRAAFERAHNLQVIVAIDARLLELAQPST